MIPMPKGLPDDPALLKQMLLESLSHQRVTAEAYQTHITDLKEQIKLLRDRLFNRKAEQTVEPNSAQLALFNEPESEPIYCDEIRVQVLKEPDRDPTCQSWMWVQASGPPDRKVVLFDYTCSRAQEVPLRLLESYRGYVMTDDYAGYNALALQSGVERLPCMAHARRKLSRRRKRSPRARPDVPISR